MSEVELLRRKLGALAADLREKSASAAPAAYHAYRESAMAIMKLATDESEVSDE